MVAAEQRREAARYLQTQHGVSERRALRTLGFGRSSHRYKVRKDDKKISERLQKLAEERPRFGYRRLHVLLRREGEMVNHKRVWRVYKALDLTMRKKTRRKRTAMRLDFVSDQLASGQRFRVLNVVDDFTRKCLVCFADTSITAVTVARLLGQAVKERGKPQVIVSDNGPEFTSRALDAWAHQEGVGRHFIDPGKPVQNAYVESFNGRFRDERPRTEDPY
ncbi:DDE-type integrase/transposase/recombinase [Deinococcus peraridilitoris]|uniref:DDE-type integrase/transposase/recombinase n=1 Tax=Deinococcus peraridilitoris TaxID=432329 RepID=UPI00031F0054|nr:DDE-type integrase/transposase/recombinase [Deinococcus peraridilitoris]